MEPLGVFAKNAAKHVKFVITNNTAVTILNNMWSYHSCDCHAVDCNIWEFCIVQNIWISPSFIDCHPNLITNQRLYRWDSL